MIPDGVHFGVPDADYRDEPGVCQSHLKDMMISPAHYRSIQECDDDEPEQTQSAKDKSAKEFGTMFHLRFLQPHLWSKIEPRPESYDGRKEIWKWWLKERTDAGITTVSHKNWKRITEMYDVAMKHTLVRGAMAESDFEVSWFWPYRFEDGSTLRRKGRIDIVPRDGRCICDIKKVRRGHGHPRKWVWDVARWSYMIQPPYYLDGFNDATNSERDRFLHIVVEDMPPYSTIVYEMDPEDMKQSRVLYQNLLEQVKRCSDNNEWPGYDTGLVTYKLPRTK